MEVYNQARPILPSDAGAILSDAFNPRDDWLQRADPALQKEAMRQWFEARYQSPEIDTPLEDGQFIYVNGGPYHASDILHSRFSDFVDEELLEELSSELSADTWDWVPKRSEEFDFDFDVELLIEPPTREAPLYLFNHRMEELSELASVNLDRKHQLLVSHMVFGACISALEAYLAETMAYWIKTNEGVLKRFVRTHPEFKIQKIAVAEVFDKASTMVAAVEERLNRQVWHRFNDVRLMFQDALEIRMPPIADLMQAVQVRHDIVHRAGRMKSGMVHALSTEDIESLRSLVKRFVAETERELTKKFPEDF